MPLSNVVVGQQTREFRHQVDARWLMAYAASIDDSSPCYMDTTRAIVAHPVFPVCLEWDAILAIRHGPGTESMTAAEHARAVHADHDIHLFQPIQPGTEVITVAHAIALEQRSPGAYLSKRIDTVDAQGTLICRTYQGTLYRGINLTDAAKVMEPVPDVPTLTTNSSARYALKIGASAAHVYTECARIWNPIHTDRAHALAAGLPDLILHGTATLARAVSILVQHYLDGDPTRVLRMGCRFSGMVLMPSELTLQVDARMPSLLGFRVIDSAGVDVIKKGFLVIKEPQDSDR